MFDTYYSKMKNQRAIFLGKSGYLDYITGQEYNLTIFSIIEPLWGNDERGYLWVSCKDHIDYPYTSIKDLLKHWNFI